MSLTPLSVFLSKLNCSLRWFRLDGLMVLSKLKGSEPCMSYFQDQRKVQLLQYIKKMT